MEKLLAIVTVSVAWWRQRIQECVLSEFSDVMPVVRSVWGEPVLGVLVVEVQVPEPGGRSVKEEAAKICDSAPVPVALLLGEVQTWAYPARRTARAGGVLVR